MPATLLLQSSTQASPRGRLSWRHFLFSERSGPTEWQHLPIPDGRQPAASDPCACVHPLCSWRAVGGCRVGAEALEPCSDTACEWLGGETGRLACAEPGPNPDAGVGLLLLPGASRDTTDLSYRLDWLDSNGDCQSRDLTLLTGEVKPQRNRRPVSQKGQNETAGPSPLRWETQRPAPSLGRETTVTGISSPPACAPPLSKWSSAV